MTKPLSLDPCCAITARESSDPTYDALAEAVGAATTMEEQQRLVKEADMYPVEQHWFVWGPVQPWFEVYQPWVIGFNGETELGHRLNNAQVIGPPLD